MKYDTIVYEKGDLVGNIKLNRPRVLNALTFEMMWELLDLFKDIAQDDEARVIVITGAGRAFSSGDDMKSLNSFRGKELSTPTGFRLGHYTLFQFMRHLPKPIIAGIHGYAAGAGCDFALACDLRVMTEDAMIGDMRAAKGIIAGTGATYWWPRLVGLARASEILFTGELLTAEDALRLGIVNRVVPPEKLDSTLQEMAGKLAKGATFTIGLIKHCLTMNLEASFAEALENELVAEHDSADLGTVKQMGMMIKLSRTPGKLWRAAPGLGQHTDEVLSELGYSSEKIQQLRGKRVVA